MRVHNSDDAPEFIFHSSFYKIEGSIYDLNSYCTADGHEGLGWNVCAWGNISKYADSNGFSALDACCACGGGTQPAPPTPPAPPPPPSNCSDHPKSWRSSEGDACCVYQWNSYCTPEGKEGRSKIRKPLPSPRRPRICSSMLLDCFVTLLERGRGGGQPISF